MHATDQIQESGAANRLQRGARGVLLTLAIAAATGGCALSAPSAGAAGPGEYSAPEWLPLRAPAKVGCVRTNCEGPYHGYWAIDLLDPEHSGGDPVFAAGAGQVSIVQTSASGACGGSGTASNILQVDHGGGVTTRYIHLASFSVPGGAWVDQNTQIGVMGTTGYTDPCPTYHLHYEKRVNGANVDPGPLKACDGAAVRSYPSAIGSSSWDDLVPEAKTVSSTGTGCETPPPPAKPTCTDVETTTAHDVSAAIRLSCSGETITYSAPSAPSHGTITGFDAAAGTLTYVPAAGFSGSDSFTFAASNAGGGSDRATVRITVLPAAPSCAPVSAVVVADTATAIALSCSGQAIVYAAPSTPAHGTTSAPDPNTGALTYTPAAGYRGTDSFTYAASNAGGQSEPATVTLTIASAPVITGLRARASCVTSARMQAAPVAGQAGLAFSFAMDQPATVEYVIYRRDGSPQRRACPRGTGGHTQDTFTKLQSLGGPGVSGDNAVALAAALPASRRRMQLRRSVPGGSLRVRLAAITAGRVLTPGTYVLLVTASNAVGQRSAQAHVKFFVLAKRATAATIRVSRRRSRAG